MLLFREVIKTIVEEEFEMMVTLNYFKTTNLLKSVTISICYFIYYTSTLISFILPLYTTSQSISLLTASVLIHIENVMLVMKNYRSNTDEKIFKHFGSSSITFAFCYWRNNNKVGQNHCKMKWQRNWNSFSWWFIKPGEQVH